MVLSSAPGLAFLVRGFDLEFPARSTGSHRRSVPMLHAFPTESSAPISSLVQVTPVPELSLTAVKLSHDGTGAQYLHLAREDGNNLFRCVCVLGSGSDSLQGRLSHLQHLDWVIKLNTTNGGRLEIIPFIPDDLRKARHL